MDELTKRFIKEAESFSQIVHSAKLVSNQLFNINVEKLFNKERPDSFEHLSQLIKKSREIIDQSALSQKFKNFIEQKSDIEFLHILREIYLNSLKKDKV